MQAFSTSASLSLAHTASRGAASWTSPFIVMAIGCLPGHRTWIAQLRLLKYRREAAKERVALGHVQCIFATAKSLRRRFGIGTGGPWWLGPAQYEHIPLPPARADAVERGHARGLRRPLDSPEHARFRGSPGPSRGGHGCDSPDRGGPDRSGVQGRYL